MQTLHVKTNEQVMGVLLEFINTLSRQGAEIELLDHKAFTFEKQLIDQSFKEIREGDTFSSEEVEREELIDQKF